MHPDQLNCYTLPPRFHTTHADVCKFGIGNDIATPTEMQASEAQAYANLYFQLEDSYDKYGVTSWSEKDQQRYGSACMENAAQIVKSYFDWRLKELNDMKSMFQDATRDFKERSDADVHQMQLLSAVLEGEGHPSAADVKKRATSGEDIFDYKKKLGDSSCTSMMESNEIGTQGSQRGLRGLSENFTKTYTAPAPDGSKYSAKEYTRYAANVEKDIRDMADQMADQAEQNFASISGAGGDYSKFMSNLKEDVNTGSGVQKGLDPGTFKTLRNSFMKKRDVLTAEMSTIRSGLRGFPDQALNLTNDTRNDQTFEVELNNLESEIKGECLSRQPVDQAIDRIRDMKSSSFASDANTKSIKERIRNIMKQVRTSPEQKIEEIKAIEKEITNPLVVQLDAGTSLQKIDEKGNLKKTALAASTTITASSYLKGLMDHCEAEYSRPQSKGMQSKRDMIKNLRRMKRDFKQLAKDHSKEIKQEIVKQMIECGDKTQGTTNIRANSAIEASCTPDVFQYADLYSRLLR